MGPLNFATVMKVLKGNIPEENFVSQHSKEYTNCDRSGLCG